MISLRPRGEHASLRRAAARSGGGLIALSPWVLRQRDGEAVRSALACALAGSRVLFTSPAAVLAAERLQSLKGCAGHDSCWLAVGAGTHAALRRAGVPDAIHPQRMDSDGLLGMPQLQQLADTTVGLVTAPGGRDKLAPALEARGATVLRADVYERAPIPLSMPALAAIRSLSMPAVLAVSSAQALQRALAAAPADVVDVLKAAAVVAASERLAAVAGENGFCRIRVAQSARPEAMIRAAVEVLGPGPT